MGQFKFSLLYGFSGRIKRSQFFLGWLLMVIPTCIVFLNAENIADPFRKVILSIAFLFLIVVQISIGIKRLHDTNHSGWYFLLLIVPLVNLYLTYLLFSAGSNKENRYGLPL